MVILTAILEVAKTPRFVVSCMIPVQYLIWSEGKKQNILVVLGKNDLINEIVNRVCT